MTQVQQYSRLNQAWPLSPIGLQTESVLQIEQVQKEQFGYLCNFCLLLK